MRRAVCQQHRLSWQRHWEHPSSVCERVLRCMCPLSSVWGLDAMDLWYVDDPGSDGPRSIADLTPLLPRSAKHLESLEAILLNPRPTSLTSLRENMLPQDRSRTGRRTYWIRRPHIWGARRACSSTAATSAKTRLLVERRVGQRPMPMRQRVDRLRVRRAQVQTGASPH